MTNINASWLRSYHWCPIQVKMNIEGIPVKSKKADRGTDKHKSIEDTFKEKLEFEELPREELLENLNEETIVAKPEGLTLQGDFKGYKLFGRPDIVFSENGTVNLVDFKTSNKMEIYDGVRLQMVCYLYLADKEGLTDVKGHLILSNFKRSEIKNRLSEILENGGKKGREKVKNAVKSFTENKEVFPKRETLKLKSRYEFMLFKNMNKIIKSIENDSFEPNYEKCKYCSTENCPVKN